MVCGSVGEYAACNARGIPCTKRIHDAPQDFQPTARSTYDPALMLPRLLTIVVVAAFTRFAGPTNAQSFDHARFDRLLNAHVTSDGLVDYDAFAASESFDSESFDTYLDNLDDVDVSALNRDETLALWINAYNAFTIALINEHGERESIRNINRTLGLIAAKGPWTEEIARVGGEIYTLDEIEHEIIRQEFDEPRIHFALVCAAMGCPPLRREAYSGAQLNEQLNDQAQRFLLDDPDKNRVDAASGTVYLSKIFDWYGSDFGESRAEIGQYLARFYPPGPRRALLQSGDFDVEYTAYDWTLNLAPPRN